MGGLLPTWWVWRRVLKTSQLGNESGLQETQEPWNILVLFCAIFILDWWVYWNDLFWPFFQLQTAFNLFHLGCTCPVDFFVLRTASLETRISVNWGPGSKLLMFEPWFGGWPWKWISYALILRPGILWYFIFWFMYRYNMIYCNLLWKWQTESPMTALVQESQADPMLQILQACSHSLAKAQEMMDAAGLILSQTEASATCSGILGSWWLKNLYYFSGPSFWFSSLTFLKWATIQEHNHNPLEGFGKKLRLKAWLNKFYAMNSDPIRLSVSVSIYCTGSDPLRPLSPANANMIL